MFNRTVILQPTPETRLVPYEKTVTINKSSTAEDARLLKDVESEARAKIIGAYAERALNGFEVIRVEQADDQLTGKIRAWAAFRLNGQDHEIDLDFDPCLDNRGLQLFWEAIFKAVSEKVAAEICLRLSQSGPMLRPR